MTTVLLALDETDDSHLAALTATALFGPDARYLAVHSEPSPPAVHSEPAQPAGPLMWGPVYGYPYAAVPRERFGDPELRRDAIDEARTRAAQHAAELGIDATPVGEVGDPAEAIERVAIDHEADVVVVGAHQRSWFRRLFEDSVSKNLIATATVPILVVPGADD